jgi:hypothetical protein
MSTNFDDSVDKIANGTIDLFSTNFENSSSYDPELYELSVPLYSVS